MRRGKEREVGTELRSVPFLSHAKFLFIFLYLALVMFKASVIVEPSVQANPGLDFRAVFTWCRDENRSTTGDAGVATPLARSRRANTGPIFCVFWTLSVLSEPIRNRSRCDDRHASGRLLLTVRPVS